MTEHKRYMNIQVVTAGSADTRRNLTNYSIRCIL